MCGFFSRKRSFFAVATISFGLLCLTEQSAFSLSFLGRDRAVKAMGTAPVLMAPEKASAPAVEAGSADVTTAPSSEEQSQEKASSPDSSASLAETASESWKDLSETIESLRARQRISSATLESLKNSLEESKQTLTDYRSKLDEYAAHEAEYEQALAMVEALERENNRPHLGIGLGAGYDWENKVRGSLDLTLRWHDVMLLTGVDYYPMAEADDISRQFGGHASLVWEF